MIAYGGGKEQFVEMEIFGLDIQREVRLGKKPLLSYI